MKIPIPYFDRIPFSELNCYDIFEHEGKMFKLISKVIDSEKMVHIITLNISINKNITTETIFLDFSKFTSLRVNRIGIVYREIE